MYIYVLYCQKKTSKNIVPITRYQFALYEFVSLLFDVNSRGTILMYYYLGID